MGATETQNTINGTSYNNDFDFTGDDLLKFEWWYYLLIALAISLIICLIVVIIYNRNKNKMELATKYIENTNAELQSTVSEIPNREILRADPQTEIPHVGNDEDDNDDLYRHSHI